MLLSRDAKIHASGSMRRNSLLTAAAAGRDEMVTLLPSKGAYLNCGDEERQTTLVIAAKASHH